MLRAHLGLVEMHAGRRITAELALLVAVARELQVAEIRHRRSSRLRARPGAAAPPPGAARSRSSRVFCANSINGSIGRRLRRREPGQARRRPARSGWPSRRRAAAASAGARSICAAGVLRPRAVAQRLELRESLIADEVDVRALAALVHAAIAAAQRLAPVAVHDVRARQLADGEATGLGVEQLLARAPWAPRPAAFPASRQAGRPLTRIGSVELR